MLDIGCPVVIEIWNPDEENNFEEVDLSDAVVGPAQSVDMAASRGVYFTAPGVVVAGS